MLCFPSITPVAVLDDALFDTAARPFGEDPAVVPRPSSAPWGAMGGSAFY